MVLNGGKFVNLQDLAYNGKKMSVILYVNILEFLKLICNHIAYVYITVFNGKFCQHADWVNNQIFYSTTRYRGPTLTRMGF